jgi:hypothetical protein
MAAFDAGTVAERRARLEKALALRNYLDNDRTRLLFLDPRGRILGWPRRSALVAKRHPEVGILVGVRLVTRPYTSDGLGGQATLTGNMYVGVEKSTAALGERSRVCLECPDHVTGQGHLVTRAEFAMIVRGLFPPRTHCEDAGYVSGIADALCRIIM